MPPISSNLLSAFMTARTGPLVYRPHIMSSLLCLEGMMLSLFVLSTLMVLNVHFTMATMMPIILMVFAACEAAVGLTLLVMVSDTYGLDHVQNLNLLQC